MDELSYQNALRRHLRRCFRPVGWTLVGYYVLMNVVVLSFSLISGTREGEGWGYLVTTMLCLLILLLWKKVRFWREEIWAKGRPMKPGEFFWILCVFLSGQVVYQIMTTTMELFLNSYGLTMIEGLEAVSLDTESFSIFLYAGIAAPIVEELLFRGLIQRTLMPYGKKFAIFGSAFAFGIFHGNLLQSPYAFLVGLVLGYVAAEYSIGWAMVLHMINNLVIADMLNRLTMGLDPIVSGLIFNFIVSVFAVCAIIIVIRRWNEIRKYLESERLNGEYLRCYFLNGGMITLMVLLFISIIASLFTIITPLIY